MPVTMTAIAYRSSIGRTISFILCVLLAVGCAASNGYTPGGFSQEEEDLHEFWLDVFQEKPLKRRRNAQVYRFLHKAGEGTPSLVRIEHSERRTTIIGKLRGSNHDIDVRHELSAADWEAFLVEVYETEFWLSDTRQEEFYARRQLPGQLGISLDQGGFTISEQVEWFIEASNGELYHVGSAINPREGAVYELGTLMLELSGIGDYYR